jgi:hypothetical protein
MNTTTEIVSPQFVRELQSIVPQWMEKVLTEAEKQSKNVEVTRQFTPFGNYTLSVVIAE